MVRLKHLERAKETMNFITQFTSRKSILSSRIMTMVLAGFVLVVLQSSTVHAQWSNGTNINNTNNGTVSIGTTNPGGDKLIIAGNTVSGNITSHTQLYSNYNTQNNVIMELGYGTATSADTPPAKPCLEQEPYRCKQSSWGHPIC
jgi:hypothetical protein